MAIIMRLDHRGHGMIAKYEAGDPASCAAAEKVFDDHVKLGYKMADITENDGTFMQAFDPNVSEILAVPALVAG